MSSRRLALVLLALPLATLGYYFFGIVVAIHAGLWLHGEKMYYARWPSAHLFGAAGAVLGVGLAWAICRLAAMAFGRRP